MGGNRRTETTLDRGGVRKALVIGLDGASWDVLDPLLARGQLPHLARLLAGGVRATLRSTVPPLTEVAWPALFTGRNPARHGILSFRSLDIRRYDATGPWHSAQSVAGKTMFDHLGALGLPVCAFLVPMTYPVWPVNGMMVAGHPTPDLTKVYSHPPQLARWLPAPLKSSFDQHRSGPGEAMRVCFDALERLTRAMELFLAEDRHHFYMVVEPLTDFFAHRFWKLHDSTFPSYEQALVAEFGDVVEECYRRVDAAVGRLLARVPDDCVVALVSDHGVGRGPTRWFHANHWLLTQGLMRPARTTNAEAARKSLTLLRRGSRVPTLRDYLLPLLPGLAQRRLQRLSEAAHAIDYSTTRAYGVHVCQSVGGIAINLRGRQPTGIVEPGSEYEQLREGLLAGLRGLRDSAQQPIVKEAWRREDVYRGAFLNQAPDILFQLADDYRCGRRHDQLVTSLGRATLQRYSGSHRPDGILALYAPGLFRPGTLLDDADITDVLPTLYHAMGLPVPDDLDGKVLQRAFLPDSVAPGSLANSGAAGGGAQQQWAGAVEREEAASLLACQVSHPWSEGKTSAGRT